MPRSLFLVGLLIFAFVPVVQTEQEGQQTLNSGEKISTALATVTSTAISPLIGASAMGVWESATFRRPFTRWSKLSLRLLSRALARRPGRTEKEWRRGWDTHPAVFCTSSCFQRYVPKPHGYSRFLRFLLIQLFRMFRTNFGPQQTPKTPSAILPETNTQSILRIGGRC